MTLDELLDGLFPAGHDVAVRRLMVHGTASTALGPVAVLGTTGAAALDHDIALGLAAGVLEVVERAPGRPLVFLVDTQGQALARHQELLCLNGSFAHLARCVDLARRSGHVSLALVSGEAVSGGFLCYGLMADRAYALADAQVRVMDLRAMARVTKLAHERLLALAANSPIFAPGAENYLRMGALDAIWPQPSATLLEAALGQLLAAPVQADPRMQQGLLRGGRTLAAGVAAAVQAAPGD